MTTVHTTYGDTTAWIIFYYVDGDGNTHTLYTYCENWSYDIDDTAHIALDYSNRGHTGFTPNIEKLIIKLKNVYVITEAAWNILKTQLQGFRDNSGGTLKIRTSVDNTTSVAVYGYELFDGTSDEMPIIITSMKGFTKEFKGNTTKYLIKSMVLRQVGALS